MQPLDGKKIILAGDHAGFGLKQALAKLVEELGGTVVDFGPASAERCDFPAHVGPAAAALAAGQGHAAIFIDGAGYPSGILANKWPGVYAAVANDTLSARLCREHSDANALCLGGQVVGVTMGREIAKIFLTTAHNAASYGRRVGMVKAAEASNFQGGTAPATAGQGALQTVTLEDVQNALRECRTLAIHPSARLTPSAEDILKL